MRTNPIYKLFSTKMAGVYRVMFALLALTSVMATSALAAPTSGGNTVICTVVSIYNSVVTAIFVIGLMLMILGGALYAGGHLMPGNTKGTIQGYGMGMVLGGVIGIIIAVIAPFILQVLTGNSPSYYSNIASTNAGC